MVTKFKTDNVFDTDGKFKTDQTVISKEDSENEHFNAVATCRYWYDDAAYGKAYCCALVKGADGWDAMATADGKETKEAKDITDEGETVKFKSYLADGATMVAGAAATLLAAASMF